MPTAVQDGGVLIETTLKCSHAVWCTEELKYGIFICSFCPALSMLFETFSLFCVLFFYMALLMWDIFSIMQSSKKYCKLILLIVTEYIS